MLHGLRRDLGRQIGDGLTHDLPGLRADLLLVEAGQVDQVHDLGEAAAQPCRAWTRGGNVQGADAVAALDGMSEQPVEDVSHPASGLRFLGKSRDDAARLGGVAEVVAHELLDLQEARRFFVAPHVGDSQLLGPVEHVARFAGVEVQFVAQAKEELIGPLDRLGVVAGEDAGRGQLLGLRCAVANRPGPAEQLQIAQSTPRSLHVRLQQVDRLAKLDAFLPAGLFDGRKQVGGVPAQRRRKPCWNWPKRSTFPSNSRASISDVQIWGSASAQLAGFLRGADAMPQHQAHVEHITQQPFGQGGHLAGNRGRAEEHQVHVGVGRHFPPPVAAVGDKRHPRPQQSGMLRLQFAQRRVEQASQHLVTQIRPRPAHVDPRIAGPVTLLEPCMPLSQLLFGGQDLGTQGRHGGKEG